MKLTIDELIDFIGKVEIVDIEERSDTAIQEFNDYGRWYDESCQDWRDNALFNKMFLNENSHVDFGLNKENENKMFMSGEIATAFLTFNVDGIIINKI